MGLFIEGHSLNSQPVDIALFLLKSCKEKTPKPAKNA